MAHYNFQEGAYHREKFSDRQLIIKKEKENNNKILTGNLNYTIFTS